MESKQSWQTRQSSQWLERENAKHCPRMVSFRIKSSKYPVQIHLQLMLWVTMAADIHLHEKDGLPEFNDLKVEFHSQINWCMWGKFYCVCAATSDSYSFKWEQMMDCNLLFDLQQLRGSHGNVMYLFYDNPLLAQRKNIWWHNRKTYCVDTDLGLPCHTCWLTSQCLVLICIQGDLSFYKWSMVNSCQGNLQI